MKKFIITEVEVVDEYKEDFVECKECASKIGSPTLCPSCLMNRETINTLKTRLSKKSEPEEITGEELAQQGMDAVLHTEPPDMPRCSWEMQKWDEWDYVEALKSWRKITVDLLYKSVTYSDLKETLIVRFIKMPMPRCRCVKGE